MNILLAKYYLLFDINILGNLPDTWMSGRVIGNCTIILLQNMSVVRILLYKIHRTENKKETRSSFIL